MAKQVIWSPLAKGALKGLLLDSLEKHGNKQQGKALYLLFQNVLHRAGMNPFIGEATEIENIRYVTPHPDYTLFYRHSLQKIEVLVLWNNNFKWGKLVTIPKEE